MEDKYYIIKRNNDPHYFQGYGTFGGKGGAKKMNFIEALIEHNRMRNLTCEGDPTFYEGVTLIEVTHIETPVEVTVTPLKQTGGELQ